METVCLDCGTEVEVDERPTRLFAGECSGCGKPVTVLQAAPVGPAPAPAAGAPAEGKDEADGGEARPAGPPCGSCGAPLLLAAGPEGSVQGSCDDCGATFAFLLEGPPRRPRSFERGPRGPRDDAGPPRSRPCRECGGPLTFSTDAEGQVTGSCASCGNTFTLPPRRSFGPGPPRGRGPRRFDGPRGPGGRSRGPWRGGAERRGRFDRPRSGYGRRDRDDREGDDDTPYRRRRRTVRRQE